MSIVSNEKLKTQISMLVTLQNVDTQIYRLQREKENIPVKIKELEEIFQKKKENLAQLENKALNAQKNKNGIELDLASKNDLFHKMQVQLYLLKTNKEYTAKLKEIESAKADASLLEDKILELMDEIDTVKAEVEKEKQYLAEEEKKNTAEKQRIEARKKEIEDHLKQLLVQREQFVQQVDKKILTMYEKILANRDYLAIVNVVEDNTCQGCFMKVSPQVINLIRMYDDIVICEVCQRILYIEDENVGNLH